MSRFKVFPITENLYRQLREFENGGICLACGEIHHDGCEPDAENYGPCENCGEMDVFGIEQALLLGRITFKEDIANEETEDG